MNEELNTDQSIKRIGITTIDNPFDCFENFDDWFLFDIEKGYNTCSKLARLMCYDESMTQKEEDEQRELAIDRLIELDPLNVYKKVTKKD